MYGPAYQQIVGSLCPYAGLKLRRFEFLSSRACNCTHACSSPVAQAPMRAAAAAVGLLHSGGVCQL